MQPFYPSQCHHSAHCIACKRMLVVNIDGMQNNNQSIYFINILTSKNSACDMSDRDFMY